VSAPAVDYTALVEDERVHVSLYTDSRIFAGEMERIFHRGWVDQHLSHIYDNHARLRRA
jgi:hypothetical protein